MFIAEFLSNLFAVDSKEELHFDYNENDVLKDLKEISNQSLDSMSCKSKILTTKSQPEIIQIQKKKISKIVDLRTRILDSDDDDDFCDDIEAKIRRDDEVSFF